MYKIHVSNPHPHGVKYQNIIAKNCMKYPGLQNNHVWNPNCLGVGWMLGVNFKTIHDFFYADLDISCSFEQRKFIFVLAPNPTPPPHG